VQVIQNKEEKNFVTFVMDLRDLAGRSIGKRPRGCEIYFLLEFLHFYLVQNDLGRSHAMKPGQSPLGDSGDEMRPDFGGAFEVNEASSKRPVSIRSMARALKGCFALRLVCSLAPSDLRLRLIGLMNHSRCVPLFTNAYSVPLPIAT
jgi:hypothetical protein